MYKGWIICSENFQKMSEFKYGSKQKRHGKFKYFDCEVTDLQYQGMINNWEKFKSVNIEWDLKKTVDEVNGLNDGEVVVNLLNGNHFYNRYENLEKFSILQEWKIHNGLYYISQGRYVEEGFRADVTHIREDGSIHQTTRQWVDDDVKKHSYDVKRLNNYIDKLNGIKETIINLNEEKMILKKYKDRLSNKDNSKVLTGDELSEEGLKYLTKRQKERSGNRHE